MIEKVECYSGTRYAERPTALRCEGQRLEISLIEAQWRAPGKRCFRVRTRNNQRFELEYDEVSDLWQINPLEALIEEEKPDQ